MTTLKEWLKKASDEGWAVPHFNVSNFVQLKGIIRACAENKSPVLIGTSEGESKFIGFGTARTMVDSFREETGLPIFLNADHIHSVDLAKEAIDAGYDSVLIDLSKESYENNLAGTKDVAVYAKEKSGVDGFAPEISIEAELGYLATDSSKIYKEAIEIPADSYTKPYEAEKFVKETGIDRLAPAVGNLHGIAANKPKLDFELIKKIREVVPGETALVMHGGSGISDSQMQEAIRLGFNNIHVSTELRVAYIQALRNVLSSAPEETTPYKIYVPVVEAVASKTAEKLTLFGSINKT